MIKFARVLAEAVTASGCTIKQYADDWGLPQRTIKHWLNGTPPSKRYIAKIETRFPPSLYPGLFEEEILTLPVSGNGRCSTADFKLTLARTHVVNLTFIFEWLVLEAGEAERNGFRALLGSEWEQFMHLARALVNEESRKVGFTEKRLKPKETVDI